MRTLSHKLAESLATRLNEVMPAGFRLTAQSGWLTLHIDGTSDGTITTPEIADDDGRERAERLETAVYGVLNSVQDSISEHLRIPWPSEDGRTMAPPKARCEGHSVRLWYGESETMPVLAIPEIPFTEIEVED